MLNIQDMLDKWFAGNEQIQQYVSRVYYLPDGQPVPADVTQILRLSSALAPERGLRIGLVVKAPYAVGIDLLLAMVATRPD